MKLCEGFNGLSGESGIFAVLYETFRYSHCIRSVDGGMYFVLNGHNDILWIN